MATSEPVVLHHGREVRGISSRRRAAGCCNGLLGGARRETSWFATTLDDKLVRSGVDEMRSCRIPRGNASSVIGVSDKGVERGFEIVDEAVRRYCEPCLAGSRVSEMVEVANRVESSSEIDLGVVAGASVV